MTTFFRRTSELTAFSSAAKPVASMTGTLPRWTISVRKASVLLAWSASIALCAAPKKSGPLTS